MFLPVLVINSELNGIKKGAHFYIFMAELPERCAWLYTAAALACAALRLSIWKNATAAALL
jgi:hypothetical protein